MDIIRYPEGHPIRVAAQKEYEETQARRHALANTAPIRAAIEYVREQGETRRPVGAIWPASVDETEALNAVGADPTPDAIAVLRDWVFRARPVTIRY